jgi:hypothetical protein
MPWLEQPKWSTIRRVSMSLKLEVPLVTAEYRSGMSQFGAAFRSMNVPMSTRFRSAEQESNVKAKYGS